MKCTYCKKETENKLKTGQIDLYVCKDCLKVIETQNDWVTEKGKKGYDSIKRVIKKYENEIKGIEGLLEECKKKLSNKSHIQVRKMILPGLTLRKRCKQHYEQELKRRK